VRGQSLAGNHQRIADALDGGRLLCVLEAPDEGPPLLARNRLRGIEERRATAQDQGVGGEPINDLALDLVAGRVELAPRDSFHIRFDGEREEHGEAQPGHQQDHSAPEIARRYAAQQIDHPGAPG